MLGQHQPGEAEKRPALESQRNLPPPGGLEELTVTRAFLADPALLILKRGDSQTKERRLTGRIRPYSL